MTMTLFVSTVQSFVLIIVRHHIGYIFFDRNNVESYQLELIASLMVVLAGYTFADGLQCSMSGLLKGAGKQRKCGPIVVCCYFLGAIPLAVLLTFQFDFGVVGLAVGTTTGTWLHFISYATVLYNINWTREAEMIKTNVELGTYERVQQQEMEGGDAKTTEVGSCDCDMEDSI
jgi:MATE family multidrug resistance protein